jgi:hypothetical protein
MAVLPARHLAISEDAPPTERYRGMQRGLASANRGAPPRQCSAGRMPVAVQAQSGIELKDDGGLGQEFSDS